MDIKKVSLMSLLFEGKEHSRLEAQLKKHAEGIGFSEEVSFKNGMNPDVLLLDAKKNLFLGDAKDSANEGPSNTDTADRIFGYIRNFTECIRLKEVSGGLIAICTNSRDAANDWKRWLNEACVQCGLDNPNFSVKELSLNTFIIIW